MCYLGPNVLSDAQYSEAGVQIHATLLFGSKSVLEKTVSCIQESLFLDRHEIGANCILHSWSCYRFRWFWFCSSRKMGYIKIPQLGKVIVQDHVELGQILTIDRATLGATLIQKELNLIISTRLHTM